MSEPPIGSRVFALVGHDGSSGYAQYALAPAAQTIPIPPGLTIDQACALVVAGLTALLILRDVSGLQPGERVLVPAAAGGVGSYAIQLAKLFGAGCVIGAAGTPERWAAVLAAGADAVVDYTQPDWPALVREYTAGHGADVILEMNGGKLFTESLASLAPFGRMVVYGMAGRTPLTFDDAAILRFFYNPALNQSLHVFNLGLWFGMRPQAGGAALGELIGLAASGKLKVQIGHVLPLSRAADAHRMIEARATTGKVILHPWDEA